MSDLYVSRYRAEMSVVMAVSGVTDRQLETMVNVLLAGSDDHVIVGKGSEHDEQLAVLLRRKREGQ